MNKIILGIITLILALGLGQSAYADLSMCEDKMKKMAQALQLTADQQKKMASIRDQFKSSQKANWESMKASHDLIKAQIQSDKMDEAKLDEAVDQLSKQIGTTMKAKAMMKNQIFMMLTPKQKEKFASMMKEHENKMKKMFEKCDDND